MRFDELPLRTLKAVDSLNLAISVRDVPEIHQVLSQTVLFRGKKFRPMLSFLVGRLLGLTEQQMAPYARAAEFVHAATLAHDDVIDEAPKRRDRPTLNARVRNSRAVLAGDLLLARVMVELSALGELEIIHDLSQTVEALVEGEWLQLEARGIAHLDCTHLDRVALKKTGSLMAWCCVSAGRLAKLSADQLKALSRFGEYLGLAFQMIDDIIDFEETGGKPIAQDLREGLVNYVTLELLEATPQWRKSVEKVLGNEQLTMLDLPWKETDLILAMDAVRRKTQTKLEAADQILTQLCHEIAITDPESLRALRAILVYLKERVR